MIEIHPLIKNRRSIRAFSEQVPDEDSLSKLFEAARWAASSFNEQPWRFMVGIKGTELFDKILSFLYPTNFEWAQNAPVLILSIVKEQFSHNNSDNLHAWHDLGLAMGNLSLEATHQGIGLHQLAGFDRGQCQEWLNRYFHTGGHQAVTITAAGYSGVLESLPENLREKEHAPRVRKEMKDFVIYSL